ncbi:MFS transporter [Priestia filamentosa]|uniref:MFS transporter n=1 Tax=Priestia filamentosa TaxID=1402861 RepID=UPI002E24A095|nr:MFS transporter [Priestia filamentosa]
MKESLQKKTRFRWVVMLIIFITYMIAGADRANISVVIPYFQKEFELSNTDIGAMASLFYIGYAIIQIPSGFIYSKFGTRKIFTFSMIVTSVATFFIGTASSALQLKIGRVLLGIAEGPLPVGIISTINRWFPGKEKGTATGIYMSAMKFAPAIVPPLCAYIIYAFGWREVFYIFAIPGIIFALFWLWLVKDNPEESPYCSKEEREYIKSEEHSNIDVKIKKNKRKYSLKWVDKIIRAKKVDSLDTNRKIFLSWNIWGCTLGYFFMVGIVYAIMTWIPTYLVDVKKYSIMEMGFVASAPWIGAILGNLIGGWLSDNVFDKRRKPLMIVTAASTMFSMYALLYAPNNPMFLSILLIITGVLLNLGYSTFLAYPMGITSKEKLPLAASIVNTGGSLGGAFAPFVVGLILDKFNWDMVFTFLSASSLITFILLFTIIEPREKIEPMIKKEGYEKITF